MDCQLLISHVYLLLESIWARVSCHVIVTDIMLLHQCWYFCTALGTTDSELKVRLRESRITSLECFQNFVIIFLWPTCFMYLKIHPLLHNYLYGPWRSLACPLWFLRQSDLPCKASLHHIPWNKIPETPCKRIKGVKFWTRGQFG